MRMLFLGQFFPCNQIQSILLQSHNKIGLSNHNFEMSIINGLCRHEDVNLECFSIPGVFSFPYNNQKFYTKSESYKYKSANVVSVGFCNLPIVKELWATIAMAILIIKYLKNIKEKRVDIIINTPDNRLLNALSLAKFFTKKKVTQTVIIPDIPNMVTAMDKQTLVKGLMLKYLNRKSMRKTSNCNGLVLLTEAMMDFIDKPVPYIVMEGIIDIESTDVSFDELSSNKEIILYTGTLRKIFGVMNLVNAFQKLKDIDAELWICGSGDSKEAIEKAAKEDSRIKFYGLVDSNTALKMQRQASILVNPRTSDGEYTKYSFPSKTIEYLLSGKSVIINRLPGIPEEYYQYVYTPSDESIDALAECLAKVVALNKAERYQKARNGKQFIVSQKNSYKQVERILNLISQYQ